GDEGSAIVIRGNFDQPHLKAHSRFAEQVRLRLQPANKRRQIVFVKGTQELVHDKRLPRTSKHLWMLDQVLDEGGAALPAVDSPAEIEIERDAALQQEGRDRLVLPAASTHERLVHGGKPVGVAGAGTQGA